jgi:hypothetical protein
VAAVLTGFAGMLGFHILAALAAVVAAVSLCVVLHRGHLTVHFGRRRRLRGDSGRDHQRHHFASPEFE